MTIPLVETPLQLTHSAEPSSESEAYLGFYRTGYCYSQTILGTVRKSGEIIIGVRLLFDWDDRTRYLFLSTIRPVSQDEYVRKIRSSKQQAAKLRYEALNKIEATVLSWGDWLKIHLEAVSLTEEQFPFKLKGESMWSSVRQFLERPEKDIPVFEEGELYHYQNKRGWIVSTPGLNTLKRRIDLHCPELWERIIQFGIERPDKK